MSVPTVASYHEYEINPANCMARRLTEFDRNWTIFVGKAGQCKNAPVSGTDICTTCLRHEANGTAEGKWHGRVNDTDFDSLPADSHIAGSEWFHESMTSGKLVWRGVEKPRSAREEGNLPKAPRIADLELLKFVRGDTSAKHLNIEELSARRQISGQQLRDMLCLLHGEPTGVLKHTPKFSTKAELCAEIRRLMVPGAAQGTLKVPMPKGSAALLAATVKELTAALDAAVSALLAAEMRVQALEAKCAIAAATLA
jgi:hypothetical protein